MGIESVPPDKPHRAQMLKPIAVLAAFLAVANGRNLQPALRLRGGVDAGQVANGALALQGINAGMLALSPSKAGEVYEVEMSEVDNLIVKYIGGMMLSVVISVYSAIQGKDATTALGYGMIYPLIQLVQGALNDDSAKFGQEGPIKYLNLLISSVVTYTLLQGGPHVQGVRWLVRPQRPRHVLCVRQDAGGLGRGQQVDQPGLPQVHGRQHRRHRRHLLAAHHHRLCDQDPRHDDRPLPRLHDRQQLHLEGRPGLKERAVLLDGDQRGGLLLHPFLDLEEWPIGHGHWAWRRANRVHGHEA